MARGVALLLAPAACAAADQAAYFWAYDGEDCRNSTAVGNCTGAEDIEDCKRKCLRLGCGGVSLPDGVLHDKSCEKKKSPMANSVLFVPHNQPPSDSDTGPRFGASDDTPAPLPPQPGMHKACWMEHKWRGIGHVGSCPPGFNKVCDDLMCLTHLCYPMCPAGWQSHKASCWQDCTTNYTQKGDKCIPVMQKADSSGCPSMDRCGKKSDCAICPPGWDRDGCHCTVPGTQKYTVQKFVRPKTDAAKPGCNGKDDDQNKTGRLCHKKCDPGWHGSGAFCKYPCGGAYAYQGCGSLCGEAPFTCSDKIDAAFRDSEQAVAACIGLLPETQACKDRCAQLFDGCALGCAGSGSASGVAQCVAQCTDDEYQCVVNKCEQPPDPSIVKACLDELPGVFDDVVVDGKCPHWG